jgi:hypothetical protein
MKLGKQDLVEKSWRKISNGGPKENFWKFFPNINQSPLI